MAKRAREVAARVNRITGGEEGAEPLLLDAGNEKAAAKVMRGHDAALSAVPYFLNLRVGASCNRGTMPLC